jgi:hypothetical protein
VKQGKDSPVYSETLQQFGSMWQELKQLRPEKDFHKEPKNIAAKGVTSPLASE